MISLTNYSIIIKKKIGLINFNSLIKQYFFGLAKKNSTNNIYIYIVDLMSEETWKTQYKQWKILKPYQIKLIDEGPKSQSQAWLLNSMWCECMDLKRINISEPLKKEISSCNDPWEA